MSPKSAGAGAGKERSQPKMEEAKAKMREALERKNAGAHPTARGVRKTGPIEGTEGVGGTKRTFRPRKTG